MALIVINVKKDGRQFVLDEATKELDTILEVFYERLCNFAKKYDLDTAVCLTAISKGILTAVEELKPNVNTDKS